MRPADAPVPAPEARQVALLEFADSDLSCGYPERACPVCTAFAAGYDAAPLPDEAGRRVSEVRFAWRAGRLAGQRDEARALAARADGAGKERAVSLAEAEHLRNLAAPCCDLDHDGDGNCPRHRDYNERTARREAEEATESAVAQAVRYQAGERDALVALAAAEQRADRAAWEAAVWREACRRASPMHVAIGVHALAERYGIPHPDAARAAGGSDA